MAGEYEDSDVHIRRVTTPVVVARRAFSPPPTITVIRQHHGLRDRIQSDLESERREILEGEDRYLYPERQQERRRRERAARKEQERWHTPMRAESLLEHRELRQQTRAEEKEREQRLEFLYAISTWEHNEDRNYRRIDLHSARTHESHDGLWRDVPHDVFDPHRGRDLIVHLKFPVHLDHSDLVEDFSRLRRLGDFAAARHLFTHGLQQHMDHPFIFTQYAELLYDMADYTSLASLDSKPAFGSHSEHALRPAAFQMRQLQDGHTRFIYRPRRRRRQRAHHTAPPGPEEPSAAVPEAEISDDVRNLGLPETRLLNLKFRLVRSLGTFHSRGTINEALADAKEALHSLVIKDEVGSTEIQLMCLALQAFRYIQSAASDVFQIEIRNACMDWAAWPDLYQTLLDQGRIWDFHDVFTAVAECFGDALASTLFLGKPLQQAYRDKLIEPWADDEEDESTPLAQLDLLVSVALSLYPTAATRAPLEWLQKASRSLVQRISTRHPSAMGTRPVMRWMLLKAYEASFSSTDPFAYLDYCPGLVLSRGLLGLPIYVPFEFEVPGWFVLESIPEDARSAVEATLQQARQLQDHNTQVLCLQLLIMQTPDDPSKLFAQLADLQKRVMGDSHGYLCTLLSSYISVCRSKDAQIHLLGELRKIENWTESNVLRHAMLHLAKQQMERVLSAKIQGAQGHRVLNPVSRASMIYYPWLPEDVLQFVERLTGPEVPSYRRSDGRATRPRSYYSRSPPRVSGAVPARTRSRDRRRADSAEPEEHHTSSDDDAGNDDDATGDRVVLVKLPPNYCAGMEINLTLGSGGRVVRQDAIHPEGGIERMRPTKREHVPGVALPATVESDDSESRDIYKHTPSSGTNPRQTPPHGYDIDDNLALAPVPRFPPDRDVYDLSDGIRVYPW